MQNAVKHPRSLLRVGKKTWGIICPREVYHCALHQSKDKAQHHNPSHPPIAHNYSLHICSYTGGHFQRKTKLAASPTTHQVQAGHPNQHSYKAYGLNMGRLPMGLVAALHRHRLSSHNHWLPCLVGPC
jgi:hypothetical protein